MGDTLLPPERLQYLLKVIASMNVQEHMWCKGYEQLMEILFLLGKV